MAAETNERSFSKRGSQREIRATPDWGNSAVKNDHLWQPTSVCGDFCYVGDVLCSKNGSRLKCSACNIIVHQNCLNMLIEKLRFMCKSTFDDIDLSDYKQQRAIEHHWVRRNSEKRKCQQCMKGFQCKTSFSSKEIVAISCSWCKVAYHNKESCFTIKRIDEECRLGEHAKIIVPSNWILKPSNKRVEDNEQLPQKSNKPSVFLVKPIPTDEARPILVFINPKSGGNQGLRLLQKFQWLLNPRQVFDLTEGGPKTGLMIYQKVPNLKVLACGGDGTVGWILSVIDQLGITPAPAVGVLPLGTGNDLARALGWGGGYTDEPVVQILTNMGRSRKVLLDRWRVDVQKNPNATADESESGNDNLPLNVINNYFSMGVDAHIALEFHEAREAHPEKFNSRMKNKMFYGQLGGKDLLLRKWKRLTDYITLECDGVDLTSKIRKLRLHAIVFLNIPSYGGGTHPWNRSLGGSQPSFEDGLIEVVGLTTYQLPLLQAGGHGTCIAQCKTAKIVTTKTIPMQVDGEACKLSPSLLTLSLLNKATMLASRRTDIQEVAEMSPRNLEINVYYLDISNYNKYRSDIELLTKSASLLHKFEIDWNYDLEMLRDSINTFLSDTKDERFSNEWYFLDCRNTEKTPKFNRNEEKLHYISDITKDNIYIVETSNETRPLTPKTEIHDDSPRPDETVAELCQILSAEENNSQLLETNVNIRPLSALDRTIKACQTPFRRMSLSDRLFEFSYDSPESISFRNSLEPSHQALMLALENDDLEMAKNICAQSDFSVMRNMTGCFLLQYASFCGHDEIVTYMTRHVFSNFKKVEHLL